MVSVNGCPGGQLTRICDAPLDGDKFRQILNADALIIGLFQDVDAIVQCSKNMVR